MGHEQLRFQCQAVDHCQRGFTNARKRAGHESTHNPHTCNMCGSTYDRSEWSSCPFCDPEVDA